MLRILVLAFFLAGCSSLPLDGKYDEKKEEVYREVDGERLSGDLYIPHGKRRRPAVVLVHGGGWDKVAGDMEPIAKDLARSGFFVFNIRYRLAPRHHFPAPVEDVRAAIRYLKDNAGRLGVNPNKIAGWGYSAGANLILLAGLDPAAGLRAIVSGGTPANLVEWKNSELARDYIGAGLDEKRAAWEAASPVNQVQRDSPPVFLYHGAWDKLVSVKQMYQMESALKERGVPVSTYEIPALGHYLTYGISQKSVDLGIGFLTRELGPLN